ncbi:amidohydrolase [Carnobacteriaceae bacterium zg-ZUI240]|nr:amidohydrolase [Carnobacteriaceae bacterium zg-ZUI240]
MRRMTMGSIKEYVKTIEQDVIALRRHFHQHPEPSLKEYETAKKIESELDKLNIPHVRVGETGVLATIKGQKGDGRTILLRADIDALEIAEKTGVSYASLNEGLSHACGHDAHTAMGLGTARILNDLRDTFAGKVYIAFQQAEEIGAGAKQFVASGLIDDIDESIGVHTNSASKVGTILARGGAVNASCDIFKIHLKGLSAHVGKPHLGIDAVVAASQLVVSLQTIVAREISPVEEAVLGVGRLQAGTRYNIVANDAEIEGTIRAYSNETRAQLKAAIERVVSGIAATYRCEYDIKWHDAAAPVINDAECAKEALAVAQTIDGFDTFVDTYEKSMGADDYADYTVKKPGVYVLLGTQSGEDTAYGHHHEKFNIDERALSLGVEFEVNYILSRLNK